MESKHLPFRKRKIDKSILDELGILPTKKEHVNTYCETKPFGQKTGHGVHFIKSSQQLEVQSEEASLQTNVTSMVLDDVGEQGGHTTIGRQVSEFNGNLHSESAQRNRMSSGDNNCYYPETAPVKTSQGFFTKYLHLEYAQRSRMSSGDINCYYPETAPVKTSQGSHDTDGACEGMANLLKASASCSTDTKDFTVLIKDADKDVDKFTYPIMSSDKAAPVAFERIWEGSMQFYFNTTVPMIAFFKSGQKLLDINWSSLVVIKGKIPLEDFENYIKDLPRSRTKKLMVISLCWKQNASTAAIEFLKAVVKRYETTKQVAYAQPSPDVRLYMYPWNEVCTTTLVKCGYLEEKAAIADRSELLIGCVVWRRNQITSGSLLSRSEAVETYSLKEPDCTSPTGKNQATSDTLLKLSYNKGVEPLKEQGLKSSIRKDQKNLGYLLEQSKDREARLLKERETRLLKLSENKGFEPLKEQGFQSSIGKGQKSTGLLLEQSKKREAGPLKKREIRGARLLKEQEVWSPVRADNFFPGAALKHSTGHCTDPQKEQGIKFQNEHLESGRSNLPSMDFVGQQTASTSASGLPRTFTYKPLFNVEETAVGKSIFERYDNEKPSVGNHNDLPGLLSSMLEPSAVKKIKPSLPLHSDSFKTASRNLQLDSPGHHLPSEFPVSLESSNNPKRFGEIALGKSIFERYDNAKPSVGNHNDLPGLISSMLEPSAVEKIKPSLPLHSDSYKTTSWDLPMDSPGNHRPSEFPVSLESSNKPKRFGETAVGKSIFERYDNEKPSVGNHNDLAGLVPSMLEPSAVETTKPSLPLHSDSFKTTYRYSPMDSPGYHRPSEFPVSLESSNTPKRFGGVPVPQLMKIRPPSPNKNNSWSRASNGSNLDFLNMPSRLIMAVFSLWFV